jgi:hypothetical protein
MVPRNSGAAQNSRIGFGTGARLLAAFRGGTPRLCLWSCLEILDGPAGSEIIEKPTFYAFHTDGIHL